MSTMLQEIGTQMRISTLTAEGKRRKLPRGSVSVPKDDTDAIIAEVIRQAEAARVRLGIALTKREPVV